MRTEVGRLNGRIDRDYMFNDHFIRGQKKMEIMLDISFSRESESRRKKNQKNNGFYNILLHPEKEKQSQTYLCELISSDNRRVLEKEMQSDLITRLEAQIIKYNMSE